jgi:hypothetical protein
LCGCFQVTHQLADRIADEVVEQLFRCMDQEFNNLGIRDIDGSGTVLRTGGGWCRDAVRRVVTRTIRQTTGMLQ